MKTQHKLSLNNSPIEISRSKSSSSLTSKGHISKRIQAPSTASQLNRPITNSFVGSSHSKLAHPQLRLPPTTTSPASAPGLASDLAACSTLHLRRSSMMCSYMLGNSHQLGQHIKALRFHTGPGKRSQGSQADVRSTGLVILHPCKNRVLH